MQEDPYQEGLPDQQGCVRQGGESTLLRQHSKDGLRTEARNLLPNGARNSQRSNLQRVASMSAMQQLHTGKVSQEYSLANDIL